MANANDDWRKLFGSIDVGMGSPAPVSTPRPAPLVQPPPSPTPPPPNPTTGPVAAVAISTSSPPPPANQPPDNPGVQQVAPGVFQMASTFTQSMAKFAAGGFQTTRDDMQKARLETCQTCAHRQHNRCVLCGCIISLKVKMPHEHCPIGKWENGW